MRVKKETISNQINKYTSLSLTHRYPLITVRSGESMSAPDTVIPRKVPVTLARPVKEP